MSNNAKNNVIKALGILNGKGTIKELVTLFASKGCQVSCAQILDVLCHLFKEERVSFIYDPSIKDDIYYVV